MTLRRRPVVSGGHRWAMVCGAATAVATGADINCNAVARSVAIPAA